jgi:hypothetical protein
MKLGLFKFKYGEEMIAEYEIFENSYYIQNAAALMPTNEMSWHLLTWLPYTTAKKGMHLPKSEVWFVADLEKDMIEYYENWKKAAKKLVKDELAEANNT